MGTTAFERMGVVFENLDLADISWFCQDGISFLVCLSTNCDFSVHLSCCFSVAHDFYQAQAAVVRFEIETVT
ncbi:hypothetical protein VTN49DRAFT_6108 [Thermomyces lanuginosus]|uniref:uncharacterized protein n=1 Tax=Thermomyces lanuginosus TaxID=5541 RepID=UPI0037442947